MDENLKIPTVPATPSKGVPEKFVRTFAGDLETLKQGGVPDLVPLDASQPSAKDRLVTASAIPDVIPTPPPAPAPQMPEEPTYTPPAPEVSPLKTYQGDFSSRMQDTHASATSILAAEQDRRVREVPQVVAQTEEKSSRNGLPCVIAGVVLLIVGVVGAYIGYARYQKAVTPVAPEVTVAAPIFVDDREQISGQGTALFTAIQKSVERSVAPNAVRLIYTASSTQGSIFSALLASAPEILPRNVIASSSMAGVVNAGGTASPFFILSVTSYSNTFSGMLWWEVMMPRDLAILFPAYPSASTTTATTTLMTSRTLTPQSNFHDDVINTHDVRIYRDAAGNSIVLYGYWNETTLVIARDANAFTEILERLANSRTPQK
ncbi:MAG: hypothetical protein WC217_03615 [Candidatus Paceibacterota bacterium]